MTSDQKTLVVVFAFTLAFALLFVMAPNPTPWRHENQAYGALVVAICVSVILTVIL